LPGILIITIPLNGNVRLRRICYAEIGDSPPICPDRRSTLEKFTESPIGLARWLRCFDWLGVSEIAWNLEISGVYFLMGQLLSRMVRPHCVPHRTDRQVYPTSPGAGILPTWNQRTRESNLSGSVGATDKDVAVTSNSVERGVIAALWSDVIISTSLSEIFLISGPYTPPRTGHRVYITAFKLGGLDSHAHRFKFRSISASNYNFTW